MIIAVVAGNLIRDPEQRTAKFGKQFTTGTIRAKTHEAMQYVRFVAVSESAQGELIRLADGDALAIQGARKAETYEKDGKTRLSLSLIVDRVLALRQPPKERKPTAPEPPLVERSRQERLAGSGAPSGGPNDDIPFGAP
jgi:single-stranded DNA-binding protein